MAAKQTSAIFVPCRITAGTTWGNACIHAVGPKLVVISSTLPLPVGGYVDIRRGTLVVIGRVLWLRDDRFGIRTQDPVSATALVNEPRLAQRPAAGDQVDRRHGSRERPPLSLAAQAERSRRLSATLQFAALTAAASGGAYLLASHLYLALAVPFTRISAVLGS